MNSQPLAFRISQPLAFRVAQPLAPFVAQPLAPFEASSVLSVYVDRFVNIGVEVAHAQLRPAHVKEIR